MTAELAYAGLLAEPMHKPTLMSTEAEKANWAIKRATKTSLLFKHFAIDPTAHDAWQNLAIALAEAHVPGFQRTPQKQGRPKDNNLDLTLLMLFRLLRLRYGPNERQAAERIASRGKLPQNAEALRSRFRRALKDKQLPSCVNSLSAWKARCPERG